jgi:MarR family transcriptional regulator, 2-MHQ and catechol-resistance regulon repressor
MPRAEIIGIEAPDRITEVGLLVETAAGLRRVFAPTLEEQLGVAGQSFEILLRLRRSPDAELRMSDLAAQTGITPSGLTRAIDRLEDAGLVTREACSSDRRVAYAHLTADGAARTDEAVAQHRADIDELFGSLFDPEEEAELVRLLRRLRDRVHPEAARVSGDTDELALCNALNEVEVNGTTKAS